MRENLLRTLWQQDAYAVNGWLSLPATFSAEVMAHQGWDSLTIDLPHGLIDYQTAVGLLHALSATRTVPLVRVPWLDPAIIMKVLDAGAYGVICPMVNSASEAREFVAGLSLPAGRHSKLWPDSGEHLCRAGLRCQRKSDRHYDGND